jgi:DNA adenine methylase
LFSRSRGIRRAAYFIYMNRLCWNGLYRVNRDGRFNVPYGRQSRRAGLRPEFIGILRSAGALLSRAEIICDDFRMATSAAEPGDFVFFDPPYITSATIRPFSEYTAAGFSEYEEVLLAKEAIRLARRGVHVVVTHSGRHLNGSLYDGYFHVASLTRAQTIAGDPGDRCNYEEDIVSTFPLRLERKRTLGARRIRQPAIIVSQGPQKSSELRKFSIGEGLS